MTKPVRYVIVSSVGTRNPGDSDMTITIDTILNLRIQGIDFPVISAGDLSAAICPEAGYMEAGRIMATVAADLNGITYARPKESFLVSEAIGEAEAAQADFVIVENLS